MPKFANTMTPWRVAAAALLAIVAAAYALTSPGRIDIIDGQLRYEVLTNLLNVGRPIIEDPALLWASVGGLDGDRYTGYGFATALTSWPLMFLGRAFFGENAEQSRFVFSLVGTFYGAATVGILLALYRRLGATLPSATTWSLVFAFATLWWPSALSTFDQVQHGFFVLLALYLAYRGTLERSPVLIALGGCAGGLLINFAESYALVLPALGLVTLTPLAAEEPARDRAIRYFVFGAGCFAGLVFWFAYNVWRFGDPFISGRGRSADSVFGNPLVGMASLLMSPGKGILLYSPTVVLAGLGLGTLWRQARFLVAAAAATCIVHLEIVSSLAFFGGDWAWGPRYLVPLMPLCALPWPFVRWTAVRRGVAGAVVTAGVVIQGLAISIDHQRFFFERELVPFFWSDSTFYFRESALLARPGEIVTSVRHGVPREATRFAPSPYPEMVTYAPFGPDALNTGAARWMRGFSMFYLPRPWPLWFLSLPAAQRPFEPVIPAIVLLLTTAAGGVLLHRVKRHGERVDQSAAC